MSCKATGCGQCACITSETDPAEVSPATLSAIARAAEIWTHPDNTEASRPALQHPLAPEQPANVAEAFAQLPVRTVDTLAYGDLQRAASTFEGGLVTERYLDRLVAGFSACIDIRNYTPLLGMVYAAKYIADKLERHYVLDSRAAALSRIKAQAWGCMSFAKRFALPA